MNKIALFAPKDKQHSIWLDLTEFIQLGEYVWSELHNYRYKLLDSLMDHLLESIISTRKGKRKPIILALCMSNSESFVLEEAVILMEWVCFLNLPLSLQTKC